MPVEKSAGVVVFHVEKNEEIKYLFLKHKPASWDFPKGLIEKGETPEKAALRECREETGLQGINIIPGFKKTIKFFFKVKYGYQLERGLKMGETVLKFVTYFVAQSETKDVKVSFEHEDYEWLSFNRAIEILKRRKENKKLIEEANEFILKNEK
jgi:8-oxo-dGTP pyrophosphatase MutT (NUDIX family)